MAEAAVGVLAKVLIVLGTGGLSLAAGIMLARRNSGAEVARTTRKREGRQ